MSCTKAQQVFEQDNIGIRETLEARKEKIEPDRAWEMIQAKEEVVIAKGRKILTFAPKAANKEEILQAALGRSGSLRAPAVDTGKRLIIGYTQGIYDHL